MDNRPSFDPSLLIPIGVGLFALMGICGILVMGRINDARATVEEVPTATSFEYAYIGTEPALTTLTAVTEDGLEEQTPTEAPEIFTSPPETLEPLPSTPAGTQVIIFTNTSALITLPPLLPTNTPSRTPTSSFVAPFGAGTFDNTDNRFVYSGTWERQTGVTGAYQNTLNVSGTQGNSVSFLFIGNELRVFFQASPSLGTIRLTLDSTSYDMSQSNANTQRYEWVLSATTTGTHTVTITHQSGGSINFDGIIVPVVSPTPTNTSNAN